MSTWIRPAAAALAVALLAGCAAGSAASDVTPGYDGKDRTIDTSPFEVVGPGPNSPTTLPDSLFEPKAPTTTATPTTTTPLPPPPPLPTTTTTTLPFPGAPTPASITDICGFSTYVSSFYGLTREPPDRAEALMGDLMEALDRVTQVAPTNLRPDARALRDQFREIEGVLREVGWNANAPRYVAAIEVATADSTPDGIAARLRRIVTAESEICD